MSAGRVSARRPDRRSTVIFVHSSNEMFGADRVLLQVVDALLAHSTLVPEVWLPDDMEAAEDSIQARLAAKGVATRVQPLPVLRRKYLTPARVPGLFWRTLTLVASLVRARPAAVYCATSAMLLAAPAARLAGVRTVLLHNQEIWTGAEARVLGLLASFCSTAVSISPASRRSLVGNIRSRSLTIVNAVADRTQPPPLPIPEGEGPLRFLVASRWNAWKGHGTLLAAWDTVVPAPGILVVAGSPPESGQGVDVPAIVAALREPGSVEVVGQVADIGALIDASDVVVMPSDDPEPFGLVAIEAFARYRPVIGSAGGGLGEIVTDGVDGRLFPNRSVPELAAIIRGLDRTGATRLGAAARATYERTYSLDRFDREFGALWTRVERRSRRSSLWGPGVR